MCTHTGGLYPNRFKNNVKSAVKNIVSWDCLGWSVPSLIVRACLSQDFVPRGDYLRFSQSRMPFLPHCQY